MPKVLCWNQLVGNFDVYLHAKKSTSYLTSFSDIVETLQIYYFGNLGNVWRSPSKIIVSICRKLSRLSVCKKSTSSFMGFFDKLQRYCKLVILGILVENLCLSTGKQSRFLKIFQRCANFLFWVLWVCLPTHTHNDSNNFNSYLHVKNTLHR